jgi:prepilin-type N-terminal cleavage/methylation domain-containing protein/prepilin-type processing-associated H-X9-DG protein
MHRKYFRGFTLVELLVVIAIIGILVALLLPAVQAAREAARRSECQNHLKQIAIGILMHEGANKFLPVGGWCAVRSGDPDLGYSKQPGGWPYSILSYIEEQPLHDMGAGLAMAQKNMIFMTRDKTPVTIYYCPTRRPASAYPCSQKNWNHAANIGVAARIDYAMCVGDATGNYDTDLSSIPVKNRNTGVLYPTLDPRALSQRDNPGANPPYENVLIRLAQITDGTSKTYLVGECYRNPDTYLTGNSPNDDWPAYNGSQDDKERSVGYDARLYRVGHPPTQDTPGAMPTSLRFAFGSAHSGGFYMAFCDGSVQFENYDIDLETHRQNGHRSDGGSRTDQ